jgi:branched-chain amino acid transport system ATP-binding protein
VTPQPPTATAASPGTLLEAQDVHASYGESHVLRGVSLTIGVGESIGLLGRNGMGKTTLIRTLVGHVRATRGSVRLRAIDCTRAAPFEIARRGVAYVPEGRGIFPNLNVRENLVLAESAGRDRPRAWTVERVLETFPGLRERLALGGQQLSGGEQQMLAIGRALCTNPDLLILDEATEGLAPMIVHEIWRIIGEVRQSGIASLIVDRNYRHVLAHTDHAYVMEKGVVVLEGRSGNLGQEPEALGRFLGV